MREAARATGVHHGPGDKGPLSAELSRWLVCRLNRRGYLDRVGREWWPGLVASI